MNNKVINALLMIGVLLGAILASLSVVNRVNFESDEDWVAKIEGTQISKTKYLLQLEGLSSDRRSELTVTDKEYVLERMIEEELLIKRAVDIGILKSNTMARGTIVQQMINTIIADNSMTAISSEELQEFFIKNKGFFTNANRLHVRQIYFSDTNTKSSSLDRANHAFNDLIVNKDFEKTLLLGDKTALKVPDTLMNLAKVREYLGPSLMLISEKMQPGQFTKPKRVSGGYKIIYLVNKESASAPKFGDVKDQVRVEFSKRRDDQSLRDYLENLKNWYDITRSPVL
jgi:hypothetical protein